MLSEKREGSAALPIPNRSDGPLVGLQAWDGCAKG
jgi:hypothetical protein